jgi:rare lipoprotein A
MAAAGAAPLPVAAAPATASLPAAVTAYPLKPLAGDAPAAEPVVVARSEPAPVSFRLAGQQSNPQRPAAAPATTPKPAAASPDPRGDGFVVQAGAFASRANAQRAAEALGGYVSASGKLYRVRTGPFASRGQAEAALAKVRAAGYSDARVYTAG